MHKLKMNKYKEIEIEKCKHYFYEVQQTRRFVYVPGSWQPALSYPLFDQENRLDHPFYTTSAFSLGTLTPLQ